MKFNFSWIHPDTEIKIDLKGKGIFATNKIKKGQRLIVFGGYVLETASFDALSNDMKFFPFQIDEDLYFGLTSLSEVENADYLNHSCDPTCGFTGEITVSTMRDIEIGEEITIDYAMCADNIRAVDLLCLCGSSICRGYIKADDWKNLELQEKYKGFFQPYLAKKILY